MAPRPLIHGVISEEELYAKVPQGHRARAEEAAFLSKVQSSRAFLRLLGLLSKQSGLPVDELQLSTQELVRCCWNEANKVLLDSQQQFVGKAEIAQLRKKLNACNRAAMKQVSVLKYGTAPPSGKYGMETIEFYEPLQYLEPDTRELVLELVVEKLRQLEMGNLPPSLVEALAARALAGPLIGGDTQAEQLKNAIEQLHDGLEDLKETQAQLADAEEMIKNLREAGENALDNQRELEQLRLECDVQRAAHERLTEEHSKALDDNVKLSMEVEEARAAVNEEAEAAAKEALRISLQDSKATQTTLSGTDLDEQKTQIRRLKAIIEELRMKLKETLEVMRKKGLDVEVAEVIEEMGLEEVIAKKTVFERLYEDAAKRAERLDSLRHAQKPDKAEKDEVPALDVIEQSNLGGLSKLFLDMAGREVPGINSSSALHPRQALQPQPTAAPRPPSPPKPSKPPQPNEPFWMVQGRHHGAGRLQNDVRRAPSQPSRLQSSASTPALGVSEPSSPPVRRGAPLAPIASHDVYRIPGEIQRSAGTDASHAVCSPINPKRAGIERLDAAFAPLDKAIETYSSASPGGGIARRRQRRLLV